MSNRYFIGLMSGTSADGIDAVLVNTDGKNRELVSTVYRAMPKTLRGNIIALRQQSENELHRSAMLDRRLAAEFAKCVTTLLTKSQLKPTDITAIGSHGQTIRHHPYGEVPYTIQIGDPNQLAEDTNITVVADFRRRDIAAGGQGAPLVPAFHQAQLAEEGVNTAIVNIGGISNVTRVTEDGAVTGWDIGPGNTLLDGWIQRHCQLPFDKGGAWASKGKLLPELLQILMKEPYFTLSAPKSTGPEYFNLEWLEHFLEGNERSVDVQRTLVALTTKSISRELQNYSPKVVRICGGGAMNPLIMKNLVRQLEPIPVTTTAAVGLAPEWVEASAFAWLAEQTVDGKTTNKPSVTGARGPRILGAIYLSGQE